MKTKSRFAPSPTGYLHLGNARTALFAVLYAISQKGTWYLRVENTDQKRFVPDSIAYLIEALKKLGLTPDEGVMSDSNTGEIIQKGDYGPYIQSERLPLYYQHIQPLLDKKLAYWDYLSADDTNQLQEIKQATKQPINYRLVNENRYGLDRIYASYADILQLPVGSQPVLRYALMRNETLTTKDEILGETKFDLSLLEDPVFLKSDGFPTYHFAHLIDDKLMQTTVVIRGQEWYPSLPLHTQMYLDYWGEALMYIHLPFILGEVGNKKMSKRDNNVNIGSYLDEGYLPEAIINYLSFLGWNPGTTKEYYLDPADFEL